MNPVCPKTPFQQQSRQWHACLQLQLKKTERGTRLVRSRHQGPLYVQKPFYPEGKDCAHLYLLHPPGGLVSGDTLEVDIALDREARSLVTTPGAARMYRARNSASQQRQITRLQVAAKAVLEWFPMETIVYPGASAEVKTLIQLQQSSVFTGWEITCFGLPASRQNYVTGNFSQSWRIEHNGLPVFIDRLQYSADNQSLTSGQAGFQSQPVSGFFIAGPFDKKRDQLLNTLREGIAATSPGKSLAVTWANNFCILRYLGNSSFTCRQIFIRLWHWLRPALLNCKACEPRIWLT